MGKLGNALILSPFATFPLDAGQRKRAFQTTSLLKDWGFTITFLHFAFESRWYWGHNSEDDSVLKEQWDGDVLHFYADKKVGLPPINGESHRLDEWWDQALGGYIKNLFSKRHYDLFVAHNIWLSKAFDYAPRHCLKVLEMHDLFSQRAKEFEATGVAPEFFHCSVKDELFGLRRADLLFAIKQQDTSWCKSHAIGKTQAITIPYMEQTSSSIEDSKAGDLKPLHADKVVFGMLGSDIHFNRHAVHLLIKELDRVIRNTYAPIEFILAGSICRSIGECPGFVKKLGFVDEVSEFYTQIDIAMVPIMHGTGVKIKSVEALNHGKPVLFTAHSAEGTGFEGRLCFNLSEMANWAAEIALSGVLPIDLANACYASLTTSKALTQKAKDDFLLSFRRKRPAFVQILGTTSSSRAQMLLETCAGLSLYKELSKTFRSKGLCIQPILSEYIVSVPSEPIPEISSKTDLTKAWSEADLAIISLSQRELLEDLLAHEGPRVVMIDCRFSEVENLSHSEFKDLSADIKVYYILTPLQMSLADKECRANASTFPVFTERSTWDPHLMPLYTEVLANSQHYQAIDRLQIEFEAADSLLQRAHESDDSSFSCDVRVVVSEALSELYSAMQEILA